MSVIGCENEGYKYAEAELGDPMSDLDVGMNVIRRPIFASLRQSDFVNHHASARDPAL
jgi:hypothetical protein